MIHAAIAVATATGNMQVLNDLIPVIEKNSSVAGIARTYLQFSQIMLSSGDFGSALELFAKISHDTEIHPQYSDILTHILKAGFLNDHIPGVNKTLLSNLNETTVSGAVYRAAIELAKEAPFEDIVNHIRSLNDLVLLHPRHDPGILIRLAESIFEQGIKERAISSIVIKIAKIGVQLKNRDYLGQSASPARLTGRKPALPP